MAIKTQSNSRTIYEKPSSIKERELPVRIEAKFPFDLFPDHIDIEKDKIKITRRFFFNEEEVVSVFLPDIAEIILQKGPIFASLTFIERGPLTRPVAIRYLDKHDAAWAHDTILQMITKLKISQV